MSATARSLLLVQSEYLNLDSQISGFRQHRQELNRRGISVSIVPMKGGFEEDVLDQSFDTVALQYRMTSALSPVAIRKVIRNLRDLFPQSRLVLMDDHGSPFPESLQLLDCVDRYVCRGIARTERVSPSEAPPYRVMDQMLATALFGATPTQLPLADAAPVMESSKLGIGWHIGLDKRFCAGGSFDLTALRCDDFRDRKINVHCRLGIPGELPRTIHSHREIAVERSLALNCTDVIASRRTIPQSEYLGEMLGAKIVVSPWGWHEICFRDFEAIACGSLLFKPDISHLVTAPDVLIAGETYVPVALDFSDLEQKVAWYLEHPGAAQRIIDNARSRYAETLDAEWFCDRVEQQILS